MKESVEKRIKLIRETNEHEQLKKWVCSFYEDGGCPDCITCDKSESSVESCKEDYLSKILRHPFSVWNDEFDSFTVQTRDKVPFDEVVGIGTNCDNCYIYDKCPHYKKGFVCAIDWGHNKPTSANEFMDFLIGTQYERVKRAATFEKVDGGVPDAGLSGEMDRLERLIFSKNDMGRDKLSINVEATSSSSSGGGGILAKLFGGGGALPDKASGTTPISAMEDAEAVEIKPKKLSKK